MARPKIKRKGLDWKELLGEEKDFWKEAIQEVVQEVLEAEMEETVGARKGEWTAERTIVRMSPRHDLSSGQSQIRSGACAQESHRKFSSF